MPLPDLATLLRSVGRATASFLTRSALPATCAGCGTTGAWFCHECYASLAVDESLGCQRCGRKGRRRPECPRCSSLFPPRLQILRSAYVYDGAMRRAVQRFKYSREFERGRDLGRMLASRYPKMLPGSGVDAIVPVPLHQRRYRERGFNQSMILAEELRAAVNAPVVPAIARGRNTPPQVRLRSHERMSNLTGAFTPIDEYRDSIAGKRVLIVDDVTTTGATIAALASSLQQAGAQSILAVTLAREQ